MTMSDIVIWVCYNISMNKIQANHAPHSRAFTLIELLVVIALMGILAAIVLANLASGRAQARDTKRLSDIAQIQGALEQYFDRCQQYPSNVANTSVSNGCPSGVSLANFISIIPTPSAGTIQNTYGYGVNNSGNPTDYILQAVTEYPLGDLSKNSLQGTITEGSFNFQCYDQNNAPKNYCVGPK